MDDRVAGGRRPPLDLGVPMDDVARRGAPNGVLQVEEPRVCAHPPYVARVRDPHQAGSGSRRRVEQGLEIGVAADHGVEDGDLGRRQLAGQLDNVAVSILDTTLQATPLGLGARRRQILARRIDVDNAGGPGLEKREVDDTNPGTDVQDRGAFDPSRRTTSINSRVAAWSFPLRHRFRSASANWPS